ncbi:hypothetical protein Bca4012_036667 [Brassica carinata]
MDSNSYSKSSKFVDGLNNQQDNVFCFSQDSVDLSSSQLPGFCFKPTEASEEKPAERKAFSELQEMWTIKREDMALKERLSKMKLLESLIAKHEPLPDYEEALKKKLINELL